MGTPRDAPARRGIGARAFTTGGENQQVLCAVFLFFALAEQASGGIEDWAGGFAFWREKEYTLLGAIWWA